MSLDPEGAIRVLRHVVSSTDVGAVLRGMFVLGWASPMQKLFKMGGDYARLLNESQMHYFLLAGPMGSELARKRALGALDELLIKLAAGGSGLTAAEHSQCLNLLQAQRFELTDGWRALGQAQELKGLETLAARRAQEAAARVLSRSPSSTPAAVLAEIANLVRPVVQQVQRGSTFATTSAERALGLFARVVPAWNMVAWERLHTLIESMGLAPSAPKWTEVKARADALIAAGTYSDAALLRMLRGEVSSLKGLANEIWFYADEAWRALKPEVESHGIRRGTLLGGGRELLILEQPLFLFNPATRQSLEILDGASFLTKPTPEKGIFDALLDFGISAKLEREGGVTVVQAVAKDVARLVPANPTTPIVHTADGAVTLLLRPPPDKYLPAYIAVAPELPRGFRRQETPLEWGSNPGAPERRPAGFAPLPGGVPVYFVPTLLSGAQGDEAFLLVLKSVLALP